jgi:glycosyltransferase involved in cell wall biosynthesis
MRALIVAYYYPPKGGAGTQRFAKFCKYLPDHGVEPTVLTVATAKASHHAPHDDTMLVADSTREVLRVAEAAHVPALLRLRRVLRLTIDEDEWAWAAADVALETARVRPFDVVVTTLSPYACYRIGERLQRELGLPWVVDLRDPWSLDGWRAFPSPLHARLDLRHLRRTLTGADFVIANVPEARRAFVALGADPQRTVVIPNGFDQEDFTGVAKSARIPGDPFRLVHIGTFHSVGVAPGITRNTWRRVRHRQVAPLGRTGFYLLHALANWRDQVGATAAEKQLAVHLFGRVDVSHDALIEQLGLRDLVTVHGYVSHRASVAALMHADAAFVPLHGIPADERALVVPGKLYEALASEHPVLAALPPGDAADLVRQLGAGPVVPPTDVAALTAALTRMVAGYDHAAALDGCIRARLRGFTRRSLTAQLVQVLEAAVARKPSVAVQDPWVTLASGGKSV